MPRTRLSADRHGDFLIAGIVGAAVGVGERCGAACSDGQRYFAGRWFSNAQLEQRHAVSYALSSPTRTQPLYIWGMVSRSSHCRPFRPALSIGEAFSSAGTGRAKCLHYDDTKGRRYVWAEPARRRQSSSRSSSVRSSRDLRTPPELVVDAARDRRAAAAHRWADSAPDRLRTRTGTRARASSRSSRSRIVIARPEQTL